MKQRTWEFTTADGKQFDTFTFVAENKQLAHDHAMMLRDDPGFVKEHGSVLVSPNVDEKARNISVRFVGWA
jgi:hypothetical protein